MRTKQWLPGMALGIVVSASSAYATVTEDNFLLRNSGDLVEVCSAVQSDPLFTAARNFCDGFVVSVFMVLQEENRAQSSNSKRLFCEPNPVSTRDEAIASFVQWVRADAGRMALPATDGIAEFLSQRYPCPGGH
jgi:hypothetical protein